jgi:hypothetical protein
MIFSGLKCNSCERCLRFQLTQELTQRYLQGHFKVPKGWFALHEDHAVYHFCSVECLNNYVSLCANVKIKTLELILGARVNE